eukprot:m.104250 g.104250  ORF g.104250 m.104250 type:complete len:1033 (+) comp15071_c0_seq2:405-3503(+)
MENVLPALASTASPDDDTRKSAETFLTQVREQPGFCSVLLDIVADQSQAIELRQSAAIYLKNTICKHWDARELQKDHYVIPEEERPDLQHRIFEATIHSPYALRSQLSISLQRMIDDEFGSKWEGVDKAIGQYLLSKDTHVVLGALTAMYAFTRKFRMRKAEAKKHYWLLLEAVTPTLNEAVTFLLATLTDEALLALKMVLKIYHNSGLIHMPPAYATPEACDHWTGLLVAVLQLQAPAPPADVDKDEWPRLPFWKLQKWATKNLEVFFERHGLPKQCDEEMRPYANHYIDNWACHVLEALMTVLGASFQQYVSPRVVRNCLRYMTHAVESSVTWKMMKPHLDELLDSILFPMMCQSEEDDRLWEEDPYEFIRKKYALDTSYTDPVSAASVLIGNIIEKRTKATLESTVNKCMSVAQLVPGSPGYNPRHKDGALHILSSVAETILERKKYKQVMEDFIVNYVVPEMQSPAAFVQRRACCFIEAFAELPYKKIENLEQVLYGVLACFKSDQLPVSVAAGIALLQILENNEHMRPYIEDELSWIIGKLLELLRETDNDDLTDVLSRIIEIYSDKLAPYGVALAEELARAFDRLRHYDPNSEEDQHKVLAAQGVMESIRNISDVFVEQTEEARLPFETHVIDVVRTILLTPVSDFVEDAVELVVSCTSNTISSTMWAAFEMIFQSLKDQCIEYFPEVMPPLYNFIHNGAQVFVQDAAKLGMLFEMVKMVWESDNEVEDTLCYVAKLMELMMTYLGSSELMARCVEPFLEMAVGKLMEASEDQSLAFRAQCLNVLIAGLCFNVAEVLSALEQVPGAAGQTLAANILSIWFSTAEDINNLHNRRSVILGICSVLGAPLDRLPASARDAWQTLLPVLTHMFDGLPEAYQRSLEEDDDELDTSDFDGEAKDDEEGLEDDEDYDAQPLQDLIAAISAKIASQERTSEDDTGDWVRFQTPYDDDKTYDVYVIARDTLRGLEERDAAAYQALFSKAEQKEQVDQIIEEANRREALKTSQALKAEGGFKFDASVQLPQSFHFQ